MDDSQVNSVESKQKKKLFGFFRDFHNERDFKLFILAGFFGGIAGGINNSIFNNYLSDVYKLTEQARGFLEVPRETPGLFIMVILALLNFLGDINARFQSNC